MKTHRKLKIFLIAVAALIVAGFGYIRIPGWIKLLPAHNYAYGATASPVPYPDANFAVISDIHYYDDILGTTGSAFEAALNSDRKLLINSADLADYAMNDLINSDARFVLVSGDLTKDGELMCHMQIAAELQRLVDAGKKVYVIPGNHDINNPQSVSYSGDVTTPVHNITADNFAYIYANMGYGDALARDADSLSYVAEPVPGLWLLAIDDCRYRDNVAGGKEITGGKVSQKTADWIASELAAAQAQNEAVIVMMHHGIVEHWDGQNKLQPDYLIEDYRHFGQFLASYNVRLAFTGHYHAQNITEGNFNNSDYLYDVMTGSLITAPCPIRFCEISNNNINITTEDIVGKVYPDDPGFAANASAFVKQVVFNEAFGILKKYFVSDSDANIIADAVGDAFVAFYAGDPDPSRRVPIDESRLSLWGKTVLNFEKYVLDGLWNDLPPADNNVSFSLNK